VVVAVAVAAAAAAAVVVFVVVKYFQGMKIRVCVEVSSMIIGARVQHADLASQLRVAL
jgi:hypothetical protein